MCDYQCGNSSNDEYVIELLRRAIMHADQNARVKVQQCLCGIVRGWLHRHPNREALCRLDNEENYVDVAFERFWRVTIDQRIAFNTLATALHYLRVSLNGAILDRLRASSRPKEVSLPWSAFPGEPLLEDVTSSAEVWVRLQSELLNVREQRLAYLLFHCGFKPGEIVHCCSQEFSDVCEIYCLRYNIVERLLRNVDHLQCG
jgi:hypothetical protein